MTISLSSEPLARSLTAEKSHRKKNAHNTGLWTKGMSIAYILVKEVTGQVPGTTCNGARATSAIINYQASGYVRAEREWRARGTRVGPLEWNP